MIPVGQGLDPCRAVQVLADRTGGRRLGSGYQVAADLVLTADHVIAGAQALTVRFIDGPGRIREVPARTVWAHGSVDLAVLRLDTATAGLTPVRFGQLRGAAACEAVGYPWFKLREEHVAADSAAPGTYRESHHARGSGTPHSNRRAGTLELTVAAPLAHPDPTRSAWEGMSGAAVFSDGLLVGVISENHTLEGPGWLTARPATAWYPDTASKHFQALHALIALPPAGNLTEVGLRTAGRVSLRQLPPDTALFTGRAQEIDQLVALADRTEAGSAPGAAVISAIAGLGGVGKSALAIHASHHLAIRFPDGQLYLDLRGFTADATRREPSDALYELLSALGVAPQRIPPSLDARAALYRDRLSDTRTLILLDNAADEEQVRPLLPATSTCMVLITSRRYMTAIDDSLLLSLDVLPLDDAVALMLAAGRIGAVSDVRSLVEEVAELCGRLPLALVIAAAILRTRAGVWDLRRLANHLRNDRPGRELAAFDDGARQLASVFDLSYRLLPPDQQYLYRCLGLMPGQLIDAYAATALLNKDLDEADRLLQRLADQSLIDGTAPGYYRVHDLVHAHARALASDEATSQNDRVLERLLRYYQYTALCANGHVSRSPGHRPYGSAPTHGPSFTDAQTAWAWLRVERRNLELSLDYAASHGWDEYVTGLSAGLSELLIADGPWPRALEVHVAASAAAARHGDRRGEAAELTELSRAAYQIGDVRGAADALTRAMEIYDELGDRLGQAIVRAHQGRTRYQSGDSEGAAEILDGALDTFTDLGDPIGQAYVLAELGRARNLVGDNTGAAEAAEGALELYRDHGDQLGQAVAHAILGRLRREEGDYSAAADAASAAMAIYRDLGHQVGYGTSLTELGVVHIDNGELSRAADALNQALTVFIEVFRVTSCHTG